MNLKLLLIPLSLAVLQFTSCSPAKGESTSSNSSEEYVIEVEEKIVLADCLSQEESHYIVFFHSETCSQCKQIIGDVIAFAHDNILKTYFLDIAEEDNKVTICPKDEIGVGMDQVEDIAIAGTPTILEIEEGVVTANIPGKDACLTFINEQRKNTLL